MLESATRPEERFFCLSGGFKTMAAAMQEAAAVLGAAEVFHVLQARKRIYTIKYLRSGRRSTGYRKSVPLHPASQLNCNCRVHSLEERVAVDRSTDEPLTLGEILPAHRDDPATQACRRLDWENLIQQLDAITKAVLLCLATCQELTSLVKRFRKSRSTIQNHKDRLARLIKDLMGEDILRQIQERPGWHNDMQVTREKLACRWERSTI